MATTTINARLALRSDTSANWEKSTLVLLKGEPAIEITESGDFKIKYGDGVKTFTELPYSTLTPTEISALITDGAIQSVSLASGTNNGTVKLTVDGKVTDNIAVKGLGSAAYTNSNAYAAASHSHSIANVTGLQTALDGKSATSHTHDDRYYTEAEINTKLAGKANTSHTHGSGDITSLDASKLTGTISIDRLPAGALERCVIVATDTDRLKLTTASVQKGDTVKVTGTGKMYFVIDDTKLTSEEGYTVYTAGSATSVPWSGVTGKPSTFTPSTHTHTKSQITDFPTSMPASDVAAWAKAATKPTYTKSEIGLGNVDNTADANKSVKYATSAGSATSAGTATKLQTYKQGSTTETYGTKYPLYAQWIDNSNVKLKVDNYSVRVNYADSAGNAASASSVAWANVSGKPTTFTPASHSHTIANITNLQTELNARAMSNMLAANANLNTITTAGFYNCAGGNKVTNKPSGVDNFGLEVIHAAQGDAYVQILYPGSSAVPYRRYSTGAETDGTIAWKAWTQDKLTDTNTWRGIQNNLTSDSTTDSLSAAQGKALKTLVDGKAANGHTHTYEQITGIGTHVYDATISRTKNTILAAPNGSDGKAGFRALVAADIPSIPKSKISDFPAALKNPNSLVIKLNGGSTEGTNMFTYDGSGAKSLSITPSSIGAAAASHSHNYAGSSSSGGAANSAVKLSTARNFSLTGGAVASAISFDGTGNVALSVTSVNTDYLVNGSNTLIFTCGGAS